MSSQMQFGRGVLAEEALSKKEHFSHPCTKIRHRNQVLDQIKKVPIQITSNMLSEEAKC